MFLHNLLDVLVHIANKMGLQKNCMATRTEQRKLPSNELLVT
jgi:hypothetical protein